MTARLPGLLLGTVLSDEADELGRIKVSFDERPGKPTSNWVHVVRPMASAEYGIWFAPNVGDQVVLGFLNGNLESPYMLGAIFTGTNAPPVTEPKQRVIRTEVGHEIMLDDTSGSEAITIKDSNDNIIVMNADGIEITSGGKIAITGSEVVIKGDTSIDIETSGQLTGKGSPIHLNP